MFGMQGGRSGSLSVAEAVCRMASVDDIITGGVILLLLLGGELVQPSSLILKYKQHGLCTTELPSYMPLLVRSIKPHASWLNIFTVQQTLLCCAVAQSLSAHQPLCLGVPQASCTL